MATVSQRLAFLISANADQAIKAFDKTANAAEKQMGKANKSIDKVGASMTKFGAAGLAAAGTLGAGLFKLAQGAIDDQKAQALLAQQMKTTTGATNAQVAAVEDLIDQTARATGVVDDDLRPAFATLLRATKDVTQSQGLLQTALNISAGTGKDLSAVTQALSRAATGNVTALTRLGVPLDANAKKTKDFDAIIGSLNKTFAGAAATAADTYAGKLARTKVALSEAGEEIGMAFIPVVEMGANIVTKSVGAFDKLNSATGNAAGKLASYGTVALGAISTISLLGGQAIKTRDRFTSLGEDGTRSLNNFGKAAVGAGVALTAIAATDIAFNAINNITNASGKATDKLKELNIALSKTSTEDAVRAFRELVKKESEVLRFGNIISDWGKKIVIAGGEGSKTIEDIDRSFKKLLQESGPQAAQALIDALKAQTAELDVNGNQYKDNTMLVERFQKKLDLTTGSTKALTEITNVNTKAGQASAEQYKALSGVLTQLALDARAAEVKRVAEEQEKFAEATRKSEAANEAFKNKVMDAAKALKEKLNVALKAAEENAKNAKAEFDAYAKSIADAVMGTINLGNAQATANTNSEKVSEAQKKVAETLTAMNLARASGDTEKIAEATKAWSDATKDLATAQKAPQTFMEVLKGQAADAKKFGENLLSLRGLGLEQAAFDQIAGAGAEAGNQIAVGILTGADPKGKVDEINKLIAGTKVVADLVGQGAAEEYKKNGVVLANALVEGIRQTVAKYELKLNWKNLKNLKKPIKSIADFASAFGDNITAQFGLANVEAPAMANGGIVNPRTGGTMVRVGEAGKSEAIVPLPAGGLGGSITINVNAGLGADGSKIGQLIVDELQAYQRRVGALPLKVSA
jgi:hypothetical protein